MMKKYYRWLLPALFALITFLCVRLVNDIPLHTNYLKNTPLGHVLKEIFVILLFSYLSVWLLDRWILLNRKWKKGLWLEYGVLLLVALLGTNMGMFGSRLLTGAGWTAGDVAISCVICVLCVISFYTFMRSLLVEEDYSNQRLLLEKIQNDKLQTELKFLKSQYHPHFLFNALNTVYFQIDEKNELPHRTLEMLSDLLRYQLYGGNETVAVWQEIEYLETYICLQKESLKEPLTLQTDFSPALKEQRVYPLLFIPLVENAFKFVGGEQRYVNMSLNRERNKIVFKIENSIFPEIESKQTKQGIGLENLQRRLTLLYPGRHEFKIDKTDRQFAAKLIIETNNGYK